MRFPFAWRGVNRAGALRRRRRRIPSSRANPSYMYQNYVLVVSTRGSSALPTNLKFAGTPVVSHVDAEHHTQHHKQTTNRP